MISISDPYRIAFSFPVCLNPYGKREGKKEEGKKKKKAKTTGVYVVFLASILISSPAVFAEEAPSPYIYEDEIAPAGEPTAASEYRDFVNGCFDKMGSKCGEEVFGQILDEKPQVSKDCCKKLLAMGTDCHVAIVKIIFESDTFRNQTAQGIPRSKMIWNKCVADVGAQMGAPVPLEG